MIASLNHQGFTVSRLVVFLALALIPVIPWTILAQAKREPSQVGPIQPMATESHRQLVQELRSVSTDATETEQPPLHEFLATAYCLRGITYSGVPVNPGIVAADPRVLPMGTIIRLQAGQYSGIYTVLDTGAKIKGRRLDFWLPSYKQAIEFGVRKVKIEIIRYGWDPTGVDIGSL